MTAAQFRCLLCGVLILGKLLPSPKEAVADPLQKHMLLGWWISPLQLLRGLELNIHGYCQQK